MKLGDLVTMTTGIKAGKPRVVVHEPVNGRVKLCYCGSGRWYVPAWHDEASATADVGEGKDLRRARRLLLAARAKPSPDGWIRIGAGPTYKIEQIVVGHVDVPWSWAVNQ